MPPLGSDGQTVVEAGLRTQFGLTVVGLRRGIAAHEGSLLDEALKTGDTLLLIGPGRTSGSSSPTVTIWLSSSCPPNSAKYFRSGKAPQALACLELVVGLMVSGLVPNVQAALIGCLLMGALGCVDLVSAYRSIDWKTIVLIVGMLPFSIALGADRRH